MSSRNQAGPNALPMGENGTTFSRRRLLGGVVAGGAAVSALATPALAQNRQRWTMVTSWAKGSAGPGGSADRIAAAITAMSGGRLEVLVRGAGELVSPFGVLDAVADGVAEMGHTASFFWAGSVPSAAFFTTVPFGLTAVDHNAWVRYGGGQELWTRAYDDYGLLPRLAGNSDMTMAGWSRRALRSVEDLKGLKMRLSGLGSEVYARMGAAPVGLPPSEIYLALSTGAIDAVEFLGPFSDSAYGFQKAAGHYYFPGFNKPNGTAEGLINRNAYQSLPADLQAVVDAAMAAENDRGLAEAKWFNAGALAQLRADGVQIEAMPADIMTQAEAIAADVLDERAATDPLMAEVLTSYRDAMDRLGQWTAISAGAYNARG